LCGPAARLHDRFLAGETDETAGEWQVRTKAGETRYILVTAGRLVTEEGRRFKVTTVYDITDRTLRNIELQRKLDERRILLREMQHRVKNNLTSLESMLQLELEQRTDDAKLVEILTASINRIKTISSIYRRLSSSESATMVDLSDYFASLVDELVSTAPRPEDVAREVEISAGSSDIDTAVALGLITNELITNSLKHAMPGAAHPTRIRLSLSEHDGTFVLELSDNGSGIPPDFLERNRTTLGIQLVTAVVAQHDGEIELVDPESAHFRVTIPRPESQD
jgi:two-component sensor histidine kinase